MADLNSSSTDETGAGGVSGGDGGRGDGKVKYARVYHLWAMGVGAVISGTSSGGKLVSRGDSQVRFIVESPSNLFDSYP